MQANSVPVEIANWNGASADEAVSFILRKTKIRVLNYLVDPNTGILQGYVINDKEANRLLEYKGLRFAQQSLEFRKGTGMGQFANPAATGGPPNTIESLQHFLRSRYQPEIKMLDLSAVAADPGLLQTGFFSKALTSSKFFPALMKVAENLKLDVVLINLLNNQLPDLTNVTTLSQAFPNLLNLLLMNNQIKTSKVFDTWRNKFKYLRELLVMGNPFITNCRSEHDANRIQSDLMKTFPRLVLLDNKAVRNEEVITKNLRFGFPLPTQMFSDLEDTNNTATMFITNYINLWDTNREGLMQLYQAESQFSLLMDMSHPVVLSNDNSNIDWSYYMYMSRNLARVLADQVRASRLSTGPEAIYKLFLQIPGTRHNLGTRPQDFAMEAWKLPHLPINGIVITLHGSFEEIEPPKNTENVGKKGGFHRNHGHNNKKPKLERRSFDRTFVLVLLPGGQMVVASDMLALRPYTDALAFSIQLATAVPSQGPSQVPSQVPTPGATPQPGQPGVESLPAEIRAQLSPVQQELVVKVMLETKLNLQYALMLCQQSNWNFDQCAINFKALGPLPPEAYA